VIFQVYDAPEKIESVDKSVSEIFNKCGIQRTEAVFERTTTTTMKCTHRPHQLPQQTRIGHPTAQTSYTV